jgi:hypothetical protein
MSITSNFPAIKPTLLLDFANTKQLDPRITFTRASTATYYGTQTAKAEENLLTYSQELDNADWTKTNSTITANATAAPDGTTTAEKIVSNASATDARASQSKTVSGSVVFSVFAKASEWGLVLLGPVGATVGVYFNLSTGAVGTQSAGYVGTITSVGSGWYRCSVAYTGSGTNQTVRIYPTNADGSISTGDGTSGIFLWGAQLEQRSAVTAYTPTTTATITNYIPQLLTAASGVARFDHNPTTFESLGLEIEESRTNLILQSEDLDTTWSETRATLSLNSVIAPSGALTADVLIASTDNNTHFTSQTFTGTAAAHTFTVYAKAYGLNHVALRLFNGTAQVGLAYYNLSTGATGTVTAGTATITSVGNGYYRCSLTATLAASASCTADIQLANADNTNSFIGNAFDGVTLWGTQVELGAFATSYIPTVASQVTRAAEVATMTGTNFSSWYNQGEGTFFGQFIPAAADFGSIKNMFLASDGTSSNFVGLRYASTGTQASMAATTSAVSQANVATGIMVAGTSYKLAGVYKVNDFAASRDAGTVATDTSGTVPVVTQAEIGMLAGTAFGTQTISKLAYYPLRVTDAQLQGLTS